MAVDPERLVTRYYIGGNQDAQAGVEGPNSGYETSEEAYDAIDLIYQGDGMSNMLYYVFETTRVLREEV